ncbi:MAG: putative porin [Bacteroidales bacterium]|nr:putative porin [Bacteroidales bacterium]
MKFYLRLIYIIGTCACTLTAHAQVNSRSAVSGNSREGGGDMPSFTGRQNQTSQSQSDTTEVEDDPCIPLLDHRRCFTLDPMTGLQFAAEPDTTFVNLGNRQSMESKALAITYTGNLYSPHQVEAFFDRRTQHDFIFANAYNLFRTDPSQQIYYNTRIPFTVLSYSKSGSSIQENDHLKINFAGNFNQQIGLGSQLDYVYARGEYVSSSAKPLRWASYGYYEGDQYKAYLNFNLTKLANQENGGIMDRGYVLNPDNYNDNFTEPRNMPTNLDGVWSDNDQRQVHFQHSYELGRWDEVTDPADSSVYDEFTPIATIFHSIDFESWKHIYRMDEGADATDNGFFSNYYYNTATTNDSTQYRNFSSYAGIRLNEGFSRFSQFGIGAFIGYERQHYIMLQDTTDLSYIGRNHYSNNVWVGGQLSRHLSSILTFDACARTAISGDKVGDVDINGTIQTVIPFGRRRQDTGQRSDSVIIQASGYIRNSRVSYLMDHYFSNHFRWSNDFDREQRVRMEGKVSYPRTHTSVRVGIEHINNFHYFGTDFLPAQYGSQLDIFGLEIRQGVKAGKWLNWDNAVLVQTSTDDEVLSLPNVSVESDLSFRFTIARTLNIQAGVAGYYHTSYYAPAYQPATQQFAVQHDIKCGNFPILNGYINANLKRIKFFMTMHNMLNHSVTNDTFLMPYYPIQPRRFEYGVILDLQN